ncbi:hypothetical protein ACWER9_21915 [Micromonospora sp. NPDC003944]
MNGRPVALAASVIVVGTVGLVLGAIRLASSGYWPSVGLVAIGVLLVVVGAVLLRDTRRAARRTERRHSPESDSAGYGFYPGPSGDAGSSWRGDRQRDGGHDSSGGTEPVGGSAGGDSGRGWSGWGWSGGDSGGGWSGGGDSGGGWSGGDSGGGSGS